MCNRAILENGETLKPVPNWYKTQGMCNKAVDNYMLMHKNLFLIDKILTEGVSKLLIITLLQEICS